MEYPSGQKIQVGDLVWLNEGAQQGRVTRIVEVESDFHKSSVSESGIVVCVSDSEGGGEVLIFERHFVDEGIEPVHRNDGEQS